MRIKLTLSSDGFTVPLSYQSVIQGLIYSLLDNNIQGSSYNGFVFSGLFGEYSIKSGMMNFKHDFYFYISSIDERFMDDLYQALSLQESLVIHKQLVNIKEIRKLELKSFSGVKDITIKTLSPVLMYSTIKGFTTYYDLEYQGMNDYIYKNIQNKVEAYHYSIDEMIFDIQHVKYQKKRMVKFKDCIYPSYLGEFTVKTNYSTLQLVYDCGLASKNSCGFGMIEATV